MKEYVQKVRMLVESLPYIKEFKNTTIVVKCGGVSLEDQQIRKTIIEDIVLMKYIGINPVVVHGGGVQITKMLENLGIKSEFVDGLRVTDKKSAEVLQMVLAGSINKQLVTEIGAWGVGAVGICGTDGGLFEVEKITPGGKDLGYVGEITKVNKEIVESLVTGGFIPVVAPVSTKAHSADKHNGGEDEIYNINADFAARALAIAIGAEKLIYLSDIEGVKRDIFDRNSIISYLKVDEIDKYIKDGTITGGMIPKIQSCKTAVEQGVGSVHILDGRLEHSLLLEIFTQDGIGTKIER